MAAELIDQVRFTGQPEYVFHHPLIRTVAYESQLKSDRAELHRRVAAAIESRDPASADENAALIAEHLEAAGDLHAAYGWHMRAATWATNRDIAAARLSWERATRIADALPAEDPDRAAMRSPRAPCCAAPPGESMAASPSATSRDCGSCARPPGTRHHWPSAWPAGGRSRCLRRRFARRRSWHPSDGADRGDWDPTLTVALALVS